MHSSRIVPVMAFFPVSAFNNVWEYPLFDALFGRRSRRFGWFRDNRRSLQIRIARRRLCLWQQASDFPGWNLDQNRPLLFRAADGRTFPGTSRGRRTALFMTNDQGTYDIDPAAPARSWLVAGDVQSAPPQCLAVLSVEGQQLFALTRRLNRAVFHRFRATTYSSRTPLDRPCSWPIAT